MLMRISLDMQLQTTKQLPNSWFAQSSFLEASSAHHALVSILHQVKTYQGPTIIVELAPCTVMDVFSSARQSHTCS